MTTTNLFRKSVHSSIKCHRFRLYMPISFRAPASIPKNGQKRPFFDGRVNSETHVAHVLLWTTVYTLGQSYLYPMVFTARRYHLLLLSNWPRIGAVFDAFSPFQNFPFPILNQWCTFARASGTPSVAGEPKFNTTYWITGPTRLEKIIPVRQLAASQ